MKNYEVVGVQLWDLEVNSNLTRPDIYQYHTQQPVLGAIEVWSSNLHVAKIV